LGKERGDVDGDGVLGALRIHNIMLEGTSCLLKKTQFCAYKVVMKGLLDGWADGFKVGCYMMSNQVLVKITKLQDHIIDHNLQILDMEMVGVLVLLRLRARL
jgi:hypothetical protein